MKVTVIGAGPGGYEAALYAAKQGCEVTLVEKAALGGTCLNRGCIPTKALLAVSDILAGIKGAAGFGIGVPDGVTVDFNAAFTRKDKVVEGLATGIGSLMQGNGVKVVFGHGRIRDSRHVEVELNTGGTEVVEGDKLILSTGSLPSIPPAFPCDGKKIITSDELLSLDVQPDTLTIIGGGVIGCEIAQFFSRMGTRVTILEAMPHILPNEDKDVIRPLERRFRKEGIEVVCGKGVKKLSANASHVTVQMADDSVMESSVVLVSVGRRPATAGLGLENVGIETDSRGFIAVDSHMRTQVDGIYAIGDIVPTPQLAHVASYEAFVAVDHICGMEREAVYHAVPRCVYTSPEIASAGMTEAEASAKGVAVKVGRYHFQGLGKAKATAQTEGFVKVLVDEDDVIVGGAVVGCHGTELLEPITLAAHLGLTAKQIGNTMFPHPTLGEAVLEAVHDVHKRSVHNL